MNNRSHAAWYWLAKIFAVRGWIAALAVWAPSIASGGSFAPRAEVRIVGSDLFGTEFSKALYAAALDADLRVVVALDGSGPGLDALKASRADFGILSLADDGAATLVAAGFDVVVVGYHRAVVLVAARNPATRITMAQLAAIFGGDAVVHVRWREVGAAGDWEDRPIVAVAPESGRGIAVEFFRHLVLQDRALKRGIVRYDPPLSLERWFAGDQATVAIAADEPLSGGLVKVLPVAADDAGAAFAPTAQNLQAGNYPLRLAVCVAFRSRVAPAVRPLLSFMISDAAAAHFMRAGVVPLPASERARQAVAFENR